MALGLIAELALTLRQQEDECGLRTDGLLFVQLFAVILLLDFLLRHEQTFVLLEQRLVSQSLLLFVLGFFFNPIKWLHRLV